MASIAWKTGLTSAIRVGITNVKRSVSLNAVSKERTVATPVLVSDKRKAGKDAD